MLLCNHKALELLGLTRDQLLGKTSFDPDWNVIHEDGSPFPGPDHPVPRAIAERRPVLDEVMGVYRPTKGDRVWMLVDAVPRLDSGGAVRDVVCTFREFTDRKVAEDRVAALLREKELILREVHHRIKNNMGSMMGLLLFQAAGHQDPAVKEALEDAAGRLHSMGVLYERLYRSESIGTLSLADYLRSLAGAILEVLPGSERVRLEFAITDLPLDAKLLSSIGIIVNELISNSMKHAFAGRQGGTIRIEAAPLGSGIRLAFSDDGVGMPAKPVSEGNEGFGLQLVKSIVDQYRGTLTIQGGPGTRIVMELAGPF
jgi:PAS domain S-box-containing protein